MNRVAGETPHSTYNRALSHAASAPWIRKDCLVLAERYGFTDEELDSIFNYDIKYRMAREG